MHDVCSPPSTHAHMSTGVEFKQRSAHFTRTSFSQGWVKPKALT